jgi:hypothetical protein
MGFEIALVAFALIGLVVVAMRVWDFAASKWFRRSED